MRINIVTNCKIISSLTIYSILTNNRNRVINKSQSTIGIQPKASTVSSHKLTNIPTMHFSFSHFKILLIQSINLFTPDNECLSLAHSLCQMEWCQNCTHLQISLYWPAGLFYAQGSNYNWPMLSLPTPAHTRSVSH